MFRLLKTDINILIHKKGFQFTFLLLITYAMSVTLYYAYLQKGMNVVELYDPILLSGLSAENEYSWFFYKWFPFLVILPAGFSIFNERKSRVSIYIMCKTGKGKYYLSKLISAFIVTFFTVTLPFFIQCIVNHLIFPIEGSKQLTNWETYSKVYFEYTDAYLFSSLYYYNEYVYFIVVLCITGIFAGAVAVFIVGISSFEIKYKAVLFLPVYLIFSFIDRLVVYIDGYVTYLFEYINIFSIIRGKNPIYFFSIMFIFLVLGVIFTIYNMSKKELVE